jgi:cytochrome c553
MSNQDRPPVPVERKAVDRPWRFWASAAVGGFVLIAIVFGFFVISGRGAEGVGGAIGIAHHSHDEEVFPATTPPPTNVAWTSATRAMIANADPEEGRTIATRCAGCHGETGIATVPGFPHLAGQQATAIYKQLRDYADRNRESPIMTPMAQGLTEAEMATVARYFEAQAAPPYARPSDTPSQYLALVTNGDPSRGLPPCDSCHARRAVLPGTPILEGQVASYLAQQIGAFATGQRGNDIYGLMRTVASMLTQAEIDQLARHFGT